MKQSMRLESVAIGIWAIRGDLRLMPGMYFPVTAHVFRMQSGGLLIHSPIDFSEEVVSAIRTLGEVEWILAPSLYHVSFFKKAHEQFPEARLVGPAGLDAKFPRLTFHELVGEQPSGTLGADFDHVFVGGAPTFNEIVLRHRESGCLIVADYFFNIQEARGVLTRPILQYVSDAWQKPTQSKLWRKAVKDKAAAQKSAKDVLALEFGRILVGHGQPIKNGREVAEKSLAWLF